MKKPIYYHAFTDGRDARAATMAEAKKIIARWTREGESNLRIYKINEAEDTEDCELSIGAFPI